MQNFVQRLGQFITGHAFNSFDDNYADTDAAADDNYDNDDKLLMLRQCGVNTMNKIAWLQCRRFYNSSLHWSGWKKISTDEDALYHKQIENFVH